MSKNRPKAYAVTNWATRFESHETRKLKTLGWIAMPIHHDDLGVRFILSEPDGENLLAAWVLILGVAARSPIRSVLANLSAPYTAKHLALMTGGREKTFARAFEVFSSPDVGWIQLVAWPLDLKSISTNQAQTASWYDPAPDAPGKSPDVSGKSPAEQNRKNRTEQKEQKGRERTEQNNQKGNSGVVYVDPLKWNEFSAIQRVRYLTNGNAEHRSTNTLEKLASSVPETLLRVVTDEVRNLVRQGFDVEPAALLTEKLRAAAGGEVSP